GGDSQKCELSYGFRNSIRPERGAEPAHRRTDGGSCAVELCESREYCESGRWMSAAHSTQVDTAGAEGTAANSRLLTSAHVAAIEVCANSHSQVGIPHAIHDGEREEIPVRSTAAARLPQV
ncbi:hypothetical protein OESDEN_03268, partial [Oesophagostomum dentatum]